MHEWIKEWMLCAIKPVAGVLMRRSELLILFLSGIQFKNGSDSAFSRRQPLQKPARQCSSLFSVTSSFIHMKLSEKKEERNDVRHLSSECILKWLRCPFNCEWEQIYCKQAFNYPHFQLLNKLWLHVWIGWVSHVRACCLAEDSSVTHYTWSVFTKNDPPPPTSRLSCAWQKNTKRD